MISEYELGKAVGILESANKRLLALEEEAQKTRDLTLRALLILEPLKKAEEWEVVAVESEPYQSVTVLGSPVPDMDSRFMQASTADYVSPKNLEEEPKKSIDSPKKSNPNEWKPGEDSFIRVSLSFAEAIKNKPSDCRRSNDAITARWYRCKRDGTLLTKNQAVVYTGMNKSLSGKFKGLKGKIISFTNDRRCANVFFEGDASSYRLPIADLIAADGGN